MDMDGLSDVASTTVNVGVQGNFGIDPSNPLYLHPSDNPDAMLVSVPFSGVGYRSWRHSVLRGLSVKNKLGFINGECKSPDPHPPAFCQWERCDDMVTSWIFNSLLKDIADSVEYANDVVELWIELEDRYEQTNGARLYQIQKEINDISHGTLDITSYYTKLKKLWEELSTLSKRSQRSCNCTCGAKENFYKAKHDRRLIQFLMGLNEAHTVIRGSILMMNPLPTLAQAFSLLIQDEKKREIKPNTQLFIESTSLNATISRSNTYRTNYSPNNGNHSGYGRGRPMCDYCKKPGHTKDGLQSKSDFNKGKGVVANVHPDTSCNKVEEANALNEDQNISLSKEQYG
ncbi:uncharacterized protein LOC142180099 [Nicotiana tabacum]|uniref:Uncharacterized protein LOC142180099 n=1 Tax=Nicotiana tabacum TaxID=4097 RepID=A0AC58UCC3_TOBAC